jgi:hypothetical protein
VGDEYRSNAELRSTYLESPKMPAGVGEKGCGISTSLAGGDCGAAVRPVPCLAMNGEITARTDRRRGRYPFFLRFDV